MLFIGKPKGRSRMISITHTYTYTYAYLYQPMRSPAIILVNPSHKALVLPLCIALHIHTVASFCMLDQWKVLFAEEPN